MAAEAEGRRLRLCFVIQRFGLEVAGGSELHCRWLAGRLARRHEVRVATTCALDYLEWRNHYPPGEVVVEGLPVRRHPVRRPRDEHRFALISDLVFHDEHSLADERQWVVENGPESPELVRSLRGLGDVDLFVFYSYRYYQTFFGLPTVADRAVLVPTAEEDPAIELPVFRDLFRAPRGIVYLTPEERSLVQGVSGNEAVPSVAVGSGINVPGRETLPDARARFELPPRYVLYVGRIDRNKGADRLFTYWQRLALEWPDLPVLVLVGRPALEIPAHPRIRHLGFVSEEEKFALLSRADLLVMPSAYESLSVIVLEAWATGIPVLVNSACRVLEGQCLRSGGGLFYRGYSEFAEALRRLLDDAVLRRALGEAGRRYVAAEYDWNIVERRTEEFLQGLVG
ncbi:MAG TPA: glycosyltransferase family 4 protein [Vicinamibacteria bacterium]|nr:glycosyltransferase family 4 protein [Vicinamibacteria bacterium]